jgi:uncharacterized Zn finger protein
MELPQKRFQKVKEDFICENCGLQIQGNGYTDHCPKCLYSKHVDINPGDRASECNGLMQPLSVEVKGGKFKIYYKCLKCGYTHKVKTTEQDNMDLIISLSTKPISN